MQHANVSFGKIARIVAAVIIAPGIPPGLYVLLEMFIGGYASLHWEKFMGVATGFTIASYVVSPVVGIITILLLLWTRRLSFKSVVIASPIIGFATGALFALILQWPRWQEMLGSLLIFGIFGSMVGLLVGLPFCLISGFPPRRDISR